MADEAHETIHVEADPEKLYAVAIDYDRYPEWATDIKEVEILDRDADGRGTRVKYQISALGQMIGYILAYDYADAPAGFSWTLEKAKVLSRLDGTYRFVPDGGGTRVEYTLAIDISYPIPGILKKKAAGMIVDNAMKQLKRYVEGGGGAM